MKKNYPKNQELIKRLTTYSAAAGALFALAHTAHGQIAYSGEVNLTIDASVIGSAADSIDLDADGQNDFNIGLSFSATSYASGSYDVAIAQAFAMIFPANSIYDNSWLLEYNSTASVYFPAALADDAVVSASQSLWQQPSSFASLILEVFDTYSAIGPTNSYIGGDSYGNFRGGTNYLGVRFHIGSALHYGWLRIEIPEFGNPIIVKDWAYNETAEASIETGFITPTFHAETAYNGLIAIISISFDEAVVGLSTGDFEVTGASLIGISVVSEGTEYDLALTGTEESIVSINLPAGAIESDTKVVSAAETSFALITSVGLNQITAENIKLFPNPAQETLNISMPASADINIVNTLGQTVLSKEQVRDENLDISHLTPSTYTLLVQTQDGIVTKRFVKN